MGKTIRIIIAVALILGSAFWAFNAVRERSYTGSKLSFEVGNGHVVVNNVGKEIVPVEMRSVQGRTSSFRIYSPELDLTATSKRQGTGRNAYHMVPIEVPPGRALIDVTRGENVQFVATGSGRLQATVTPMAPQSARNTMLFALVVIVAALYYLSAVLEHRWLRSLRGKMPRRQSAKRAAA